MASAPTRSCADRQFEDLCLALAERFMQEGYDGLLRDNTSDPRASRRSGRKSPRAS